MINENKNIQVCDRCHTASCWYGEFICDSHRWAGLEIKTVRELRKLNLENEENWSDAKMKSIYGDHAPFGYSYD